VKTRNAYETYRKTGYNKTFFEAHREELTIHEAAKEAFGELGVRKLPKVKELSAKYSRLFAAFITKKKGKTLQCTKVSVTTDNPRLILLANPITVFIEHYKHSRAYFSPGR